GHLRPIRDRLTVGGYAGLVGLDHRGIAEHHRDTLPVPTEGDGLPCFVSPELREREPARHFHGVLVLRGNSEAAQDGEPSHRNPNRQHALTIHRSTFHIKSGVVMKSDPSAVIYQTKVSIYTKV